MKYMVSERVESSKANCLLRTSSAPFMVRHVPTGMTPRGREERVTCDSLNQKSLPCLSTNQRLRHVLMYSPCFVSQPARSGSRQNSTPWLRSSFALPPDIAARHRLAIWSRSPLLFSPFSPSSARASAAAAAFFDLICVFDREGKGGRRSCSRLAFVAVENLVFLARRKRGRWVGNDVFIRVGKKWCE